jgi:hypothetical protein
MITPLQAAEKKLHELRVEMDELTFKRNHLRDREIDLSEQIEAAKLAVAALA